MAIAKVRREFKRHAKAKLLFLDKTYVRIGTSQTHTLVAPGEQAYVVVDDTDAYAPRYDIFACCSGERVFPPINFTPTERKGMDVKGIHKWMLLKYIDNVLAQAVGALDLFPLTLVMDRSSIYNTEEILQAFYDRGCQDLQTVYLMPAYSGKRLSPLDNTDRDRNRDKNRDKNCNRNRAGTVIGTDHCTVDCIFFIFQILSAMESIVSFFGGCSVSCSFYPYCSCTYACAKRQCYRQPQVPKARSPWWPPRAPQARLSSLLLRPSHWISAQRRRRWQCKTIGRS